MCKDKNIKLYAYLYRCIMDDVVPDLVAINEEYGYDKEQVIHYAKECFGDALQFVSEVNEVSLLKKNEWILAKDLDKLVANIVTFKERFCFKNLMEYIDSTNTNYICALYGLRRTGKTVLMCQAISKLIKRGYKNAIAYISFSANTEYNDTTLLNDVEKLKENGVKYIFIDELSYLQMDIENNCLNSLADKYASIGIKIVVTGTFSYAVKLLEEDVLFDRVSKIDTTYFSFKEVKEVLGYNIEQFLEYGGIIKHKGVKDSYDVSDYIRTSISRNIAVSLMKSEKIYELFADYSGNASIAEQKKLELLIKRLIDQYMLQILYGKVIKTNYKFKDIGRLLNNIRTKSLQDSVIMQIGDSINLDSNKYQAILRQLWGSISREDVTEGTFDFILNIFKKLNIITDIGFKSSRESIFTSHYIRYGLCDNIVKELGDMISQETNGHYSAELASDIVKGDILEAIVHLDVYKSNKYIFDKYRNSEGWEVDLVLEYPEYIDIYEIKHSDKCVYEQAKNLLNKEFIQEIELNYKKPVKSKVVLYRGVTHNEVIQPLKVFKDIIQNRKAMGLSIDRWQDISNKAEIQNWEPITIQYKNIEEFLTEL